MLQGLAIRQFFVLTNWVLAALILCGALGVAFVTMHPPGEGSDGAAKTSDDAAQAPVGPMASVKPRTAYDGIVSSGLFGPGAQAAQEAPPPAPVAAPETETQLRLKLVGTAATTPKDLFASAVILNQENNTIKTFSIGQAVVENVTIEEIYRRKVVLLNKRTNRREVLRNEEEQEGQQQAAASGAQASSAPPPPRTRIKKQELYEQVLSNYAEIADQLKPELYKDPATGKVMGITATNLEAIPIAKSLNLKNGDVLQSVNNEPIDSESKIIEIVTKYRDTSSFSVNILRNGKSMTMTYNLE